MGRLIRDIERRTEGNTGLKGIFAKSLMKAHRIWNQQKTDKEKIYSWHAPEVECIAKGKADKPYEFGCKVSLVTNIHAAPAGHFVLHTAALHGRPYDGHTLKPIIEVMQSWTGIEPKRIYVDKGYQGHDYRKRSGIYIALANRLKADKLREQFLVIIFSHTLTNTIQHCA